MRCSTKDTITLFTTFTFAFRGTVIVWHNLMVTQSKASNAFSVHAIESHANYNCTVYDDWQKNGYKSFRTAARFGIWFFEEANKCNYEHGELENGFLFVERANIMKVQHLQVVHLTFQSTLMRALKFQNKNKF